MGYAERNLAPGEAIVFQARYHWTIYRVELLLFALALLLGAASFYARRTSADSGVAGPVGYLALGFTAVAVIGFLVRWARARADEFVVTNRRVIRKMGIVSREIEQAPLEKIQDITVDQGFLGRMLGYGTVTLETASERGSLTFPRIARPEAFRNALWGQSPEPGTARTAGGAAPAAAPALAAAARQPAARERLAELDHLKQQGLVTEDEYAAKRREILAGL